ncbi:hypothetical protein N7520_008462 [Penicillium odoratum]|uniref:uncharacterized protein n=1 Tax=Penicillium odoratum TaxID=1167516 RepID=UPI00254888E7|nr:uncharacterized protein N7520_008462 [Penicillium odoratum]KAJ5761306.1 hypothetical protein N7520_008462 [Penicillium odoratum]
MCNQAQGIYEPTVCQPGYYCPSGGKSQIPCPKGHFCPLGTVEPFQCFGLSACPEGSIREIPTAGLLCAFSFDVVVITLVAWPFVSGWILKRLRGKTSLLPAVPGVPVSEKEVECSGTTTRKSIHLDPAESSLYVSQFFGRVGSYDAIRGIDVAFHSLSMRPTSNSSQHTDWKDQSNYRIGPRQWLRDLLALVPQDDIMLPDMTVEENILYSSRIRLGRSQTDKEIRQYVDNLISSLRLSNVRQRLVGEVGKRGLSGGERKRVNIALELAAAPSIIVLDEPTSGLDAKTALSVIELLKSLTSHGVTIVCVIHQPRPEIFASLDDLLLLNRGRQIYFGAAASARQFFLDSGYDFPETSNPADTMMDIMSCHDNIDLVHVRETSAEPPQRDLRCAAGPAGVKTFGEESKCLIVAHVSSTEV